MPTGRFAYEEMAQLVADDLGQDEYVNLGIGLPTLVAKFVDPKRGVILHSENGILGLGGPPQPGEVNPNLIDAGKNPATAVSGAAFFDQAESFAMVRGGHIDTAVLGAYEVSVSGDLANWATDLADPPGVGGAMDLAVGARRVLVMMKHRTKEGKPKLVNRCSLPLTAKGVVAKVFTELAVIELTSQGAIVRKVAPGVSRSMLQDATGPSLRWEDIEPAHK